jgi:hypothetical protein
VIAAMFGGGWVALAAHLCQPRSGPSGRAPVARKIKRFRSPNGVRLHL